MIEGVRRRLRRRLKLLKYGIISTKLQFNLGYMGKENPVNPELVEKTIDEVERVIAKVNSVITEEDIREMIERVAHSEIAREWAKRWCLAPGEYYESEEKMPEEVKKCIDFWSHYYAMKAVDRVLARLAGRRIVSRAKRSRRRAE